MHAIQDIKARLAAKVPLFTLIEEQVPLKKIGGRPVGCCPFHAEKTASFYVYEDHYHCYGCGAHGDAISFVQARQGLTFIQALKWLGERYNIPMPELEQRSRDDRDWQKASQKKRILLMAQQVFVDNLTGPRGKEARQYLLDRGFELGDIQEFGLGFALNENAGLVVRLGSHGIRAEQLEDCSLATLYDDKAFDFFRNRIIVPIHDTFGRLIAFGGRALSPSQKQKYKNSRYDKAATLFALDKARRDMAARGRAIVVEGYLDALQMHRYGFRETVACQGTALTSQHLRALQAATPLVYLIFDGDQAGMDASLKVVKESLNFPNMRLKVGLLPPGEDPDSFVRKEGVKGIEAILRDARDLLSFAMDWKLGHQHDLGLPVLVRDELLPWLAQIPDTIQQSFLLEKIAQRTGIDAALLWQQLEQLKGKEPPPKPMVIEKEKEVAEARAEFVKPLDNFAFELIGHLFFSQLGELDFDDCIQFLAQELAVDELWLDFVQKIVKSKLETADNVSLQKPGELPLTEHPEVLQLVLKLQAQPQAFASDNRQNQVSLLKLVFKRQNIKSTIDYLRKNIAAMSNDPKVFQNPSFLEGVKQISLLNKALDDIQKQLGSLL